MDWKLDLYQQDRAARRAARDRRDQHLGPVDHEAVGGAARRDQAALLRHPLLQPAALHGAGRADPDADDRRPEMLDQLETFVTSTSARAWCARRTRRTSSPTASASPACWPRSRRPRTSACRYDVVDDLTGKKMGRASSGTFRTADVVGLDTMAHVIKTLQDNLRRRPVLPELRHAAGAGGADREGRAGPEDRRRLLQEGRQGHPAPRPGQGRLRARAAARPTRSSRAC